MTPEQIRADERARVVLRLQQHVKIQVEHVNQYQELIEGGDDFWSHQASNAQGALDACGWLAEQMEAINEDPNSHEAAIHDHNAPAGTEEPRTIERNIWKLPR